MAPISRLRLDPENPRLPKALKDQSQEDLAVILELGFEAYAVAQSMAANGFFIAEPLLVIQSDQESDALIVVEGNRRLTALLGLTSPRIRAQFAEAERWDMLAANSKVGKDDLIPVVLLASRESAIPQIAKAHVLGKLQWRPYAQAAYVAARVDEGRSYAEVAEMIGITKGKVADQYRDHAVLLQAQELGLNASQIETAFSVLTVAMSSVKLRSHVGAPLGSQLAPGSKPIPEDRTRELGELITWVFGSEEEEPKINDSRQMTQLGNVVGTEVGLKALREGDSLDQARQKVAASGMPPRERLMNRLTTARNALIAATEDLGDHTGDPGVLSACDEIDSAFEALRSIIDDSEPRSTTGA
jgi:hypothetical protein